MNNGERNREKYERKGTGNNRIENRYQRLGKISVSDPHPFYADPNPT
jgi:hypothetical protein